MTGPVPRVKRDEVRRRLLDAAAEVFAHRGFAAARLDEIAYAAGFTKGAVYSNFAGKHALLAELIEQRVRTQLATSTEEIRSKGRPERALEDIAEVFATGIVEQGTWARLLVEIAQQAGHDPDVRDVYVEVRRSLRDELAATLATACENLGLELTVSPEQLALTLQSLRLGLALEYGTDPEQVDRTAVTAVFTDTLRALVR
ncbi:MULTISPECIES: TetR/AcrR family transcriptional regulator [unclassified Pseudonocardia]|uniref:TetR/AcrR family transcriptional regulator n=1 Tax=unclassified Pseudonocardia TaxID=2619320 RepID=UPI0001FFDBE8|nr:TetR/AcrR family transcriptional regulator [Pseudonocardia sp. Ae707_Ps1]OLM20447.1 Transcriptional regulator, TetR family [Pseudonocardia sp. Ae707_Ps1]